MRVKLCSEEDASPMSTKIRMSTKTGEPQEVEIDNDQVLAWAEEEARIRKEDVLACAREEARKRGTSTGEEINNNRDIHTKTGRQNLGWLSPELRPYPEQPVYTAEGPITHITKIAVRITQKRDVLQLPDGVSTVFISRTSGKVTDATPIRVDVPETRADQYWCTVPVNMANARATCPGSRLALDTKTLKTLTRLSTKFEITARILIHKEGEDETFGAYAHPDLQTHVLVGPFNANKLKQTTPQQKPIKDPPPTRINMYPPNWLGTRGEFIREPIIYKDQEGKYVYVTPKRHTLAQETVVEVDVPQSFGSGDDRATQNTEEPGRRTHADGGQDVLSLPDGVSVVNMTQTEHNQPAMIILPSTDQNQYWCTINVSTPNREITCTDSGVNLRVKMLKDAADLANQDKTTIRIPITTRKGVENCGVYPVSGLGTHVFVGPFTSKSGGRTQERNDTTGTDCGEQVDETNEGPQTQKQQRPGTEPKQHEPLKRRHGLSRTSAGINIPINNIGGEEPPRYKELTERESESDYIVDNVQPNAACARITIVDDKQKSIQGESNSARTRLYEFKKHNPTRSANELPERFWETHHVADFIDDKF